MRACEHESGLKVVLSKAERKLLEDLDKGKLDHYSHQYRKLLKHRISKKHKLPTRGPADQQTTCQAARTLGADISKMGK
jgi:hypothetical protein